MRCDHENLERPDEPTTRVRCLDCNEIVACPHHERARVEVLVDTAPVEPGVYLACALCGDHATCRHERLYDEQLGRTTRECIDCGEQINVRLPKIERNFIGRR